MIPTNKQPQTQPNNRSLSEKVDLLIRYDRLNHLLKYFNENSSQEQKTNLLKKFDITDDITDFSTIFNTIILNGKVRFELLWFYMSNVHEWDIQSEEYMELCMHVYRCNNVGRKLNSSERRFLLFVDADVMDSYKYERVMDRYREKKDFHMFVLLKNQCDTKNIPAEIVPNCITLLDSNSFNTSFIELLQEFSSETIQVIVATPHKIGKRNFFLANNFDQAFERFETISKNLLTFFSETSNTTIVQHFKNKYPNMTNDQKLEIVKKYPNLSVDSFNTFLENCKGSHSSRFDLLTICARDQFKQETENIQIIELETTEYEHIVNLSQHLSQHDSSVDCFQTIISQSSKDISICFDGNDAFNSFQLKCKGKEIKFSLGDHYSLTSPKDYNTSLTSVDTILYAEWMSNHNMFCEMFKTSFTVFNMELKDLSIVTIPLIWKKGTIQQMAVDLVVRFDSMRNQLMVYFQRPLTPLNSHCTYYFNNLPPQNITNTTRDESSFFD